MDRSSVIPASNAELRLTPTLIAVQHDIAGLDMTAEIIFMDDGSSDRTTRPSWYA